MRVQRRSALLISCTFLLCLALAACGSRLTPQEKARVLGLKQSGAQVGAAGSAASPLPSQTATVGQGTGGTARGPSGGGGGTGGGTGGTDDGGGGTSGGADSGGGVAKKADSTCTAQNAGSTDTGVTADTITIANIADLSGPVPGLFESAQQAVKAYVAYFNRTGSVCGRKLKLVTYDSRTDSGGDRQATIKACKEAFALVGSMSAFDNGGAKPAANCGIPDLRAASVTPARQNTSVSFGLNATQVNLQKRAEGRMLAQRYPKAIKKAAYVYLDSGTTQINAKSQMKALEQAGFTWVYQQAIDVSSYNYAPYVAEMKQKGVRYVQWLGDAQHAVRLAKAMEDQGFDPKVFLGDPTLYTNEYVQQGGSAVEDTIVFTDAALFEEASSNPELQRYQRWLQQVAPGAEPTYFGMFAWGAARLFVKLATQAGPKLTREKMVRKVRQVHNYTGNGLFSTMHVGNKAGAPCVAFIQLKDGNWQRTAPRQGYTCGGMINTGIGD